MTASGHADRFAQRPVRLGGTPAADWSQWLPAAPVLDLAQCPGLIIVAPHPDDETLGLGATAATLADRGIEVTTVSVTDGGAAAPHWTAQRRRDLEDRRRAEQHAAVAELGLPPPVCLGLPDGGLAARVPELSDLLVDLYEGRAPAPWCAATWRGDGHPDHEAVGRAAAAAMARVGGRLLEFPVWAWHWARPGDEVVPWDRLQLVPTTPSARQRKRAAIECYRSQLAGLEPDGDPILPAAVIDRLHVVGERVFV